MDTILARLLLLTTSTLAVAQVQSSMKVTLFQDEDLKIVTYSSAQSSNDLSIFLGKHSLNPDDPLIAKLLPYAVFVENRSDHSLFGITARYDFETPAGTKAHFSYFRINQDPGNSEHNLAANDISLFTPIPQLDALVSDFGGSENWPAEAKRYVAEEKTSFLRNKEIAFSIDSVVDDKGVIAGPDREATLLRVNATNDGEQDLINRTQATLARSGLQSAVADLKVVATSDRDRGTGDPKQGVNKRLLFFQTAQIRLAKTMISAADSGVDLTDMLNSWASKKRLYISRKADKR